MKKILNITFALACILALAVAFTACSSSCASHSDIDKNGYCDVCNNPYTCPGHKDANADRMCDFCLAEYSCSDHYDEDGDLKCDQCAAPFICTHEDADSDEFCDLCMADYICPGHEDVAADGFCDVCKAPYVCPGHIDANGDKKCDVCKTYYTCGSNGHKDANEDGKCDQCRAPFLCDGHVDYGSDGKCDKCNGAFVCKNHIDADGNKRCDICQGAYEAPVDLRSEFESAFKTTKPTSMVVTVTTDYPGIATLVSTYTVTFMEDGTFAIIAEIQEINEELVGDTVIKHPPVTITRGEDGKYSDGYDFEYLQPSSAKPVINLMKLKSGSFETPETTILEATIAAADTEAVLGVAYPHDVTLTVNKNATAITSISISYSNVVISCVYN